MARQRTQSQGGARKLSAAHLSIGLHKHADSIDIPPDLAGSVRTVSRGTTAIALSSLLLLAACVGVPSRQDASVPAGAILSRLPPGSPGAASYTPERPLSDAEKARRYDQIDRQALQEQEQSIAAARAAAIAAAAAPRYYDYSGPAYYGGGYGGYGGYGGWGYPRSGWSVGVGSGWGW